MKQKLKMLLANDHGGITLKKVIIAHVNQRGYTVEDLGCDDNTTVDYPDYAKKLCQQYLQGGYEFGVLICGTGIGVSIAANRISGIRCAVVHDELSARMAREHNHANVLAFGGRITYATPVENLLDAYLDSQCDTAERHKKRLQKIDNLLNEKR